MKSYYKIKRGDFIMKEFNETVDTKLRNIRTIYTGSSKGS